MLYKKYGSTNDKVSVIGFGGMRFSNPYDIDANAELITYAHSKGINYFDTAPYYCEDRSEDIFGAALRQLPRNSYFISTKSGMADGAELRAQLENSLTRLGVEQIDFFHIWCITSLDVWRKRVEGGAISAALQAKSEGLIKNLVVSSHLPGDEIKEVLQEVNFSGITLGYNALNFPYRRSALEYAGERDIGVVTMNPLSGGVIPQNSERFRFLCKDDNESVVSAALRFNISQPQVTTALVGFNNKKEIDEAVAVTDDFMEHSSAEIATFEAHLLQSFSGICTGCGYCLPCPQGIEIPKMMDAYNMNILQSEESVQARLKWHWGLSADSAKACVGCGVCEERCTQHLPIIERLSEIANLAEVVEEEEK